MEETRKNTYKIGDIYISESKLFTSIITGTNNIGVFNDRYHFSGDLVKENEFTNFTCFEANYKLVTPEEFIKIIDDWQNKYKQEYEKISKQLYTYKQNVINRANNKRAHTLTNNEISW